MIAIVAGIGCDDSAAPRPQVRTPTLETMPHGMLRLALALPDEGGTAGELDTRPRDLVALAAREERLIADTGSAYFYVRVDDRPIDLLTHSPNLERAAALQRAFEVAYPVAIDEPWVSFVAANFSGSLYRREWSRRIELARAQIRAATHGAAIVLVDSGQPLDRVRDRALAQALAIAGTAAEPVRLGKHQIAGWDLELGPALQGAAMVHGTLYTELFSPWQWLSLLTRDDQVRMVATAGLRPLPVIDAHLHVLPGSLDELGSIEHLLGVERALVMTLPARADLRGVGADNEAVGAHTTGTNDGFLAVLDPHAREAVSDLEHQLARGARGLKLLSGHGDVYAQTGAKPLDTLRVRRLLDACRKYGVPILWHVNSHLYREGFLRILDDYPDVTIVVPHFGGYLTYSPSTLRQLLEQHPNLYFDTSLGSQPEYVRLAIQDLSSHREEWRQLMIDFPGRFLFGTDLVVSDDLHVAHAAEIYRLQRSILERERFDLDLLPVNGFADLSSPMDHARDLPGLALPEPVLRKIYAENAKAVWFGRRVPGQTTRRARARGRGMP